MNEKDKDEDEKQYQVAKGRRRICSNDYQRYPRSDVSKVYYIHCMQFMFMKYLKKRRGVEIC